MGRILEASAAEKGCDSNQTAAPTATTAALWVVAVLRAGRASAADCPVAVDTAPADPSIAAGRYRFAAVSECAHAPLPSVHSPAVVATSRGVRATLRPVESVWPVLRAELHPSADYSRSCGPARCSGAAPARVKAIARPALDPAAVEQKPRPSSPPAASSGAAAGGCPVSA